jgi:hypothetical protein
MAYLSTHLFNNAAHCGHRHQGAAGTAATCQHPDHNEYLHAGGLGSEARRKQQGGVDGARRCEKRANPAGFRERERIGSQLRLVKAAADSFKLLKGKYLRLVAGGGFEPPTFGL